MEEKLISVDENGVAWIANANIKVIEIVLDKLAYGLDAEEIQAEYPHLSLAQVHSALAYYHEHTTEIDADIQRRLSEVNEMADSTLSTLRQKLMAVKRLRQLAAENNELRRKLSRKGVKGRPPQNGVCAMTNKERLARHREKKRKRERGESD